MLQYKKNPPGKRKSGTIQVDGKFFKAKYIGRGNFSKVFRVGDRVIYYTRGDCGKEVLAQFMYDRLMHLPEIIRHWNITTVQGTWYVFSSPWYRNVTPRDKSAWLLMKQIILWSSEYRANYTNLEGYDGMMRFAKFVEHGLPYSVVRALKEIANVAGECGTSNVGFDLTKSNFGVNQYGVLIFRDPIYVREK